VPVRVTHVGQPVEGVVAPGRRAGRIGHARAVADGVDDLLDVLHGRRPLRMCFTHRIESQ
jgi:hypothetical protein